MTTHVVRLLLDQPQQKVSMLLSLASLFGLYFFLLLRYANQIGECCQRHSKARFFCSHS
jgi:hypothetical protein